jgi:tRNA nucleotidyltransferase (CCA-adding enzyme)
MAIPKTIKEILKTLNQAGFEAFAVGGCVRDLLLKKEPNDWDITTNAKPNEIEKLFDKTFKVNKFGTVTVQTKSKKQNLKEVEITTFRTEEKYTDKRHPDKVKWAKTIEEDLKRRDFTINALALDFKGEVVDYFEGKKDLKDKLIRAVGNPEKRFKEDALRLIRAVRFAVNLDFEIEKETKKALKKLAGLLEFISDERIRDEFVKIIMAKRAAQGIEILRENNLLQYIIPELLEGYKVGQNKHHIYDVYKHSLYSLDYATKKDFNKYVRIAALLHDVGKPRTKEGEGVDSTFYNHEVVGAKMTSQILQRLKFPKKDIEKIVKLVRYHLFYYNVDEVGDASVRRLVRRLGKENLEELVQLRMCDRIGSGCPKALPYKLRHFQYIAEKVGQDPIDEKMLKIGGKEIMEILEIKPGPKIGKVLIIILGEVLDNPKKNTENYLTKKVKSLKNITDEELDQLAKEAGKKRNKIVEKRDEMTKKKYWVS